MSKLLFAGTNWEENRKKKTKITKLGTGFPRERPNEDG